MNDWPWQNMTSANPEPFVLSDEEMRAVLRKFHRIHIPHEGSGVVLHALLARIRDHVGRDKYEEFLRDA